MREVIQKYHLAYGLYRPGTHFAQELLIHCMILRKFQYGNSWAKRLSQHLFRGSESVDQLYTKGVKVRINALPVINKNKPHAYVPLEKQHIRCF
jgi:hypothetical protein